MSFATVGYMLGSVQSNALSCVARSRLAPDRPLHIVMLSNQPILGLPSPLLPSTKPNIILVAICRMPVSSHGRSSAACEISHDSVGQVSFGPSHTLDYYYQSCPWNSQQLPDAVVLESLDLSLFFLL